MDKKELIQKVAYLTDNMNKKIRSFRKEDYKIFETKVNYALNNFKDTANLILPSGFMTKSKKELDKLSEAQLNKMYANLHNLNVDPKAGTVKRFKETEKVVLSKSAQTIKSLLGEERYNKLKGSMSEVDFIKEFAKRKSEIEDLNKGTYGSMQVLMMMYLDIEDLEDDEVQTATRAVTKMERARELMNRNDVNMKGRNKRGNK